MSTADNALRAKTRDAPNLRISPAERNLIDRAAAAMGVTRTDFILGAARPMSG